MNRYTIKFRVRGQQREACVEAASEEQALRILIDNNSDESTYFGEKVAR